VQLPALAVVVSWVLPSVSQEAGQHSLVVQAVMEFYRALGRAEPSPGKDVQAQIDGCYSLTRDSDDRLTIAAPRW
jgi:hypothetical protein